MNLAILQARMSSTRLPNKVLKKVNGKELLAYECERLLKSKKIDKLIIATSNDKSDDAIENFGTENNIKVFRGSLDDVLSRYYECAKEFRDKENIDDLNIIRVTGDCPIIDTEVIDEVIKSFEENDCEYTSNTLTPTYPDGMDIEICTFSALEYTYKNATFKSDREHVTLYIKNSDKFKKFNYEAKNDFSNLRLTVDEQNDFDLIKNILENLYPVNHDFTYLDVISYMTKNPNLFFVNSNIQRDEGLDKSLKEDGRK
ncbi:glycosyltransferase family protein [Sulfurimonas sp.]|uniref:glycosyltransferase family protein n=1 Tax=Sulfurimonas sp. TaxID=2022749 RepID=UPI002AB18EF5|nr:glycosyltransferase family protein [Sulfurimonas sp.]